MEDGVHRSFPSVPFVVLTVDQFVGCGGGPLERQKQNSHVLRRTGAPSMIYWKIEDVTS